MLQFNKKPFPTLALALKGIEYDYKAVHLLNDGGEQVMISSSIITETVVLELYDSMLKITRWLILSVKYHHWKLMAMS